MIDHTLFALSAGLAQVMTNLDNLAVLFALVVVMGPLRAVAGYGIAQAVMLSAAMAVAVGVGSGAPGWAGYLGAVPLVLGLRGVLRQWRGGDDFEAPLQGGSVAVTALLFLSMSTDSFAVMTPLLADSTSSYRLAGLSGAIFAAALLALIAVLGGQATGVLGALTKRLETLGPYVMIAAGVYVLSNTGTDLVP